MIRGLGVAVGCGLERRVYNARSNVIRTRCDMDLEKFNTNGPTVARLIDKQQTAIPPVHNTAVESDGCLKLFVYDASPSLSAGYLLCLLISRLTQSTVPSEHF